MPPPDPELLEAFEQLCHEVSNPLMVVSGHAHLLERYVDRIPGLSEAERHQILAALASIKGNVQTAVSLMDQERGQLTEAERCRVDIEVRSTG